MTKENWAYVLAFIFTGDTFWSLIVSLYLTYVSKDWLSILTIFAFSSLLAFIGSIFLPESPMFLISSRNYVEAQKVLGKIAKVNGCDPSIVSLELLESTFELNKELDDGNLSDTAPDEIDNLIKNQDEKNIDSQEEEELNSARYYLKQP